MSKSHAIANIRSAARSAETELEHRGMPATARAVKVIGGATAAIGENVRGWADDAAGMMRKVGGRKKRKKRPRTAAHKGARPHRSAIERRRTAPAASAVARRKCGRSKRCRRARSAHARAKSRVVVASESEG
jgi:hypothetical protein